MRYIFDLEANGFLRSVTRIHSLVLRDIDTGEVFSYRPGQIEEGIRRLQSATLLVGHNIIKYDLAVIQKLYPWFSYEGDIFDTFVAAMLIWPRDVLKVKDFRLFQRNVMPGNLMGNNSLEAWGYRLGEYKGDYKGPWDEWSEEMQAYCEQDVVVTFKLWELIQKRTWSKTAMELEHGVAKIIAAQERAGVGFDVQGAAKLYAMLVARAEELTAELRKVFPPFYKRAGYLIPKRDNRTKGYEAGAPLTKITLSIFNPKSRDDIATVLRIRYGWEPTEFTGKGKPKIDEDVIGDLPYPEAPLLSEYLMVQKRIGQIAEGDEAWLKAEVDGIIYGSVNTNAAVTGRATHSGPNLGQVPKVGKPHGAECRALFRPRRPDLKMVGIDASGLELRMLAHYMARWDGGAYGRAVIEGNSEDGTDVHSLNCLALELDPKLVYTLGGKTGKGRDFAKTFIYAFLYGAGDEKIGSIVGKDRAAGARIRARFKKNFPALGKLIEAVQDKVKKQGFLIGLDGRHIPIRSSHAALNSLLQSAGALVCKQWMVEFHRELRKRNLHNVVTQVLWVHDEIQLEVPSEYAEEVGALAASCVAKAGEFFSLRLALAGEYKVGNNWMETH